MNDYVPAPVSSLPGDMDSRPRLNYYVRLESESSLASEEDTESINSIQGKETEFVQDTADTDSDSYFEYEVASLSDTDELDSSNASSSGSDDICAAEEVIAAVLGDTSMETWDREGGDDGEDSGSSATDIEDWGKRDFGTCAQCYTTIKDPRFRFCEKCYQARKNTYPPRPKPCKKRKAQQANKEGGGAVNVEKLKSCLSGLSQDSGLGSSQEFPALDFKEIKVPPQQRCSSVTSSGAVSSVGGDDGGSSNVETGSSATGTANDSERPANRKRKLSEGGSDSTTELSAKKIIIDRTLETLSAAQQQRMDGFEDDPIDGATKELCIMCMARKKDGIFLHGSSAHSCCCYKCAIKTWKTMKRCPVCNRRVSNVVKLYMT